MFVDWNGDVLCSVVMIGAEEHVVGNLLTSKIYVMFGLGKEMRKIRKRLS